MRKSMIAVLLAGTLSLGACAANSEQAGNIAQGAAMAIEDAVVLAEELQRAGGYYPGAFTAYEQKRHARTSRAQLMSRQSGEFFHASGPAREMRNEFMARRTEDQAHEALAWIYDGM